MWHYPQKTVIKCEEDHIFLTTGSPSRQNRPLVEREMKYSRQDKILKALGAAKTCSISDLAQALDVSEETIRRDVRALEEAGKVHKLHGAVRLPDNVFESPFDARVNERTEAKQAIAAAAAPLVPEHASIFIDSGSTSLHVAQALRGHRQLSVVTNALDVARALASINNNRVFFTGGEIDQDYRAAFDAQAHDFVGRFSPDLAILSMGALDLEHGMMDFHLGEASIKQKVIRSARKIMVVADESKFGRRGLIHTCRYDAVDILVTDTAPPDEFRAALAQTEVKLSD